MLTTTRIAQVIDLASHREEAQAQAGMLKLLDQDIDRSDVAPLPSSLLDRMARLRKKADENRRRELLEG
nr:hypothetical protein [uncultured Pseudomonas sp.]